MTTQTNLVPRSGAFSSAGAKPQQVLAELLPTSLDAEWRAALRHVVLAPNELLLRQGEPGDDVFILLRGRLAVRVLSDGGAIEVDRVGPGGVVGEMALLTRQPRTATVVALEESELVRLSPADFETVAAADPGGAHAFMRRVLHRARRSQIAQMLLELFGTLDEQTLHDLDACLEWIHVPTGTRLYEQGETGSDAFLVVNGRLRETIRDAAGREFAGDELGRGAAVGETALLGSGIRTATVQAVRDTHVLRLSRAAFDDLVHEHPAAMMQIARAGFVRQTHAAADRNGARVPETIALVAAHPDVPLQAFALGLEAALEDFGSALRLDSATVDEMLANPGISRTDTGTVRGEALAAWLSSREREHDTLVLQGDPKWTAWTRRCVLQADRILIVARASDPPLAGAAEIAMRELALAGRIELVLLHSDDVARPTGTRRWLHGRAVAAHHHVRLGRALDIRRLARRVTGRATGLVLGGGGARGFAHVGALRALGEAGVTIDLYGGTSIGALVGACAAAGMSVDDMERLAREFANPKKLLDRTLPVAALMAGAKVTALYRELFGDSAVEDLWVPYFAVSSGLSRATQVVHQTGAIWRAVRASTAIPAIFPPLLGDDDEVHVDGGVMNNMPLDVMRELCQTGTVIGINPMPTHDRLRSYHFGPSLSGWQALAGRLKLFGSRVRAPSILGSVMRATEINSANRMREPTFRQVADLLIEPAVSDFPILAFERHAAIVAAGYRAAKESLDGWKDGRDAPAAGVPE